MECKESLNRMHQYFDEDLDARQILEFRRHLLTCPSCNRHFQQLEQTEVWIKSSFSPISAPERLTSHIMNILPPEKKKAVWERWLKRHPAVSIASLFLLVMFGSFFSLWNQDKELVVKGSDLSQVVINGHTVIVPKGRTVDGNLTVENGKIELEGDVNGNVIVVDGTLALASTAHVAGEIKMIDQVLSWLWFKANGIFSSLQ